LEEAIATGYELVICQAIRMAVCPVALMVGDLTAAEHSIAKLADIGNTFNTSYYTSAARCFEGRLLIEQGAFEAGLALLRSELDACERTGWTNWFPEFLGGFAEGLAGVGRFPEALASIDQALAKTDQSGERYYTAELFRLKGQFLLAEPGGERSAAVDDCFDAALTIARHQGALLFELRAALALARRRMSQDRPNDARRILAPVYDQFTEGFTTADLRAARDALDRMPT